MNDVRSYICMNGCLRVYLIYIKLPIGQVCGHFCFGVCVCMCVCVCVCACMCACVCICMHAGACVCVGVCDGYVYVCMQKFL